MYAYLNTYAEYNKIVLNKESNEVFYGKLIPYMRINNLVLINDRRHF